MPEIKPVNYSYSGNGSKGELNREKTGCYKKGDENLSFLTDGNMRYIGTSSGTIDYQHYTDYIKIPITSEQGASIIGKGIGYFTNPVWYFIWDTPFSNQCDNVVGDILNSGNIYYDSKWRPKKSFYDYSTENGYEIISIME